MLCKRKKKKEGKTSEERSLKQWNSVELYWRWQKNTEFDMMAQKADNVEGQWWGWLGRWKTLAATLLIKWKKYAKGWEEDDRGNY